MLRSALARAAAASRSAVAAPCAHVRALSLQVASGAVAPACAPLAATAPTLLWTTTTPTLVVECPAVPEAVEPLSATNRNAREPKKVRSRALTVAAAVPAAGWGRE